MKKKKTTEKEFEKVEGYNVMIDGINFFYQSIKNDVKT